MKKLKYEYVKEKIEKVEGYKLLSKEYKGALKKLKLQCPEGHIFKMTWGHFQQGVRCNQCSINRQKHSYEFVKGEIEKVEGYKLLSKEYKNNHTKMKLECPEGHKFEMIYNNFQQGVRCPNCWNKNGSSIQEKEVLKYIQSITDTIIIENDRSQIININTGWNLELDIFLPDIMKAIEYNGTYWHNNDYQKYKDLIKKEQCKVKGIDLLVVNEKAWVNNKKGCKEDIKKFIVGELDK